MSDDKKSTPVQVKIRVRFPHLFGKIAGTNGAMPSTYNLQGWLAQGAWAWDELAEARAKAWLGDQDLDVTREIITLSSLAEGNEHLWTYWIIVGSGVLELYEADGGVLPTEVDRG